MEDDLGLNSRWDVLLNLFLNNGALQRNLLAFESEIKTMKLIHGKDVIRQQFTRWIGSLQSCEPKQGPRRATDLREEGNRVLGAKKNFFLCSKLYTEALYAAHENLEETALAHANRAYVLMQMGKFEEAYEDCECCLTGSYPKSKIKKIYLRQADCASQLNDVEKIKSCLEKLQKIQPKDSTAAEVTAIFKLKEKLETLKDTAVEELSADTKEKKQILCHAPQKGRFVVAGEPALKDEVIMSEKAYAFIPIMDTIDKCGISYNCQGCAESEIVPFPCYECRKVSYCSIKCRNEHASIHSFECVGYKKCIFHDIGVAYLAFRTLLEGFCKMFEHLSKENRSPESIWDEIIAFSNRGDDMYAAVIQLSVNFDKMVVDDYLRYVLTASMLTCYLKNFTNFFGRIECTLKKKHVSLNWEIVVASLLLRHIGQMVANAHSIVGMTLDDHAHVDAFWKYGDLPNLGLLQKLDKTEIFSAIYPRVSLYNHSCEPNFRNRFNKSSLFVTARKNLLKGDEILNCYGVNFRKMNKPMRRLFLSQYSFECDCKHCKGDDREFRKYHTYRCTNPKCKKLFDPKEELFFVWDHLEEGAPMLKCPYCKHVFDFRWLDSFTALVVNPSFNRKKQFFKAYKIYKASDKYLKGPHNVKEKMCWLMLRDFRDLYDDTTISSTLLEIGKDLLLMIEEKTGTHSMSFVVATTLFLDLLAIKANQPSGFKSNYDMEKIKSSFEILSDKMQSVFRKYVDAYITTSCVSLMNNSAISDPEK